MRFTNNSNNELFIKAGGIEALPVDLISSQTHSKAYLH